MLKDSKTQVPCGIPQWEHIAWADDAVQQLKQRKKYMYIYLTALQDEQYISNRDSVAFAAWFIV